MSRIMQWKQKITKTWESANTLLNNQRQIWIYIVHSHNQTLMRWGESICKATLKSTVYMYSTVSVTFYQKWCYQYFQYFSKVLLKTLNNEVKFVQ